MPKTSTSKNLDYLPSTAGVALPKGLRRALPPLGGKPSNPLAKHIMRLKALHPEVNIQFRAIDLESFDQATLQMLLDDFNEQLGVD